MIAASALTALLALGLPTGAVSSDASLFDRAWGIAATWLGEDGRSPVYLQVGGITTGAGLTAGPVLRLKGLADGRINVNGAALVSYRKYLLAEASVSAPDLGPGGIEPGVFVRRRYFPQEDFFGIGRDSSSGDRVSYTYDENAAGAFLRFSPAPPVAIDARLEYRHPDIGRGHDDAFPSIEAMFTDGSAPGLGRQPDFLVATGALTVNQSTPEERPRDGGRYELSVSRFADRGSRGYGFTQTFVDLRQYVRLVPDRHIVALRAAAWLSTTSGDNEVPFYYQPTLGGGRSVRGFREYRFRDRNVLLVQGEYRFLPMRFLEAALFYDVGTVAPRVSALSARHLLSDYGVGIRIGTDSRVLFRVDAAFGARDGTRVFMKWSGAF